MEPKVLSFDAPPAPEVPALKSSGREPGALVFEQSALEPVASPRPAVFPSTPPTLPSAVEAPAALSFPALPAGSPPATSTPAAGRAAPSALAFPAVPAPPPDRKGVPAFAQAQHPLAGTALQRAGELGPDITGEAEAALARAIARLLPFTVVVCEDWGNKSMENCRQIAQRCAACTAQFNALDSSRALDQALSAASPAEGAVAKLRRMVSGASPAELEPRVQLVRSGLERVLKDARELMPEVVKTGRHLALKALAFRAVADVTGTPADATFEVLVERRRRLLAAALQQMELLTPQLQTLERTAALQLSQCDQLLHVTLPLLARQQPR